MSFSYFNTEIGENSTDYTSFVRFTLDDKDSTAYELEDEEITALYNETSSSLTQKQRNYVTAIKVGEYLVRKYSKQASFSSGGTSVQYAERAKAFGDIVGSLRMKLSDINGSGGVLYPSRSNSFGW